MTFIGRNDGPAWSHRKRGTFGRFTDKGSQQISYVATRFSKDELQQLKVARQVFDRSDLNIRELMQREIDDKRVQREISQYLNPGPGPVPAKFFPPLVVAMTVRSSDGAADRLASRYPKPNLDKDNKFPRIFKESEKTSYEEWQYNNSFCVRIPLREDEGCLDNIAYHHGAEICWHSDDVNLLVLDGQHRLMALKAVLGKLDSEDEQRGYGKVKLSEEEIEKLGFSSLPVTIIFPPELHEGNEQISESESLVSVFRRIFVDVNKNAKPVSQSRNILLDEGDAVAVFARNLIDRCVTEKDLSTESGSELSELPLYLIEWDSPERREFQINEPRAISSIGILFKAIGMLLGDEDDDTFRAKLRIEEGDNEIDPDIVGKDGFSVPQLGRRYFSGWQREILELRFERDWEEALVSVIAGLFPARKLIDSAEAKRIEIGRAIEKNPYDEASRHAMNYLVGTKSDREIIEKIAEGSAEKVGTFRSSDCREALRLVREEFLREEVEIIKSSHFGRIFFTQLGQLQILDLVFYALYKNAPDEFSICEVAQAYVSDFNRLFEGKNLESIFSPTRTWNELSLAALGMQNWKRQQVRGLLRVSLLFFGDTSELSEMMGGKEKWGDIKRRLADEGYELIQKSLRSRLPYRVKSEVAEIVDEHKRAEEREKLVLKEERRIISELRSFVKEHEA